MVIGPTDGNDDPDETQKLHCDEDVEQQHEVRFSKDEFHDVNVEEVAATSNASVV